MQRLGKGEYQDTWTGCGCFRWPFFSWAVFEGAGGINPLVFPWYRYRFFVNVDKWNGVQERSLQYRADFFVSVWERNKIQERSLQWAAGMNWLNLIYLSTICIKRQENKSDSTAEPGVPAHDRNWTERVCLCPNLIHQVQNQEWIYIYNVRFYHCVGVIVKKIQAISLPCRASITAYNAVF